jgi:TolB-like protein/DNA-binding winged helix-turn-helix (wHTH) protein/tetratricopeptide (TPR) repeat protein
MDSAANPRACEFLGFRLDPRQHVLLNPDGEPVPLTSRAFQTLLFMLEHPGDLLRKEMLMQAVWPDTIVEENNLNQCITALRRALGDTRGDPRFIVTIAGRGYRFVAPVTWRERDTPAMSFGADMAGRSVRKRLWQGEVAAQTVSIAVLPFENLSPQPDDAYFSTGLHQEIVDQLSKVRSLSVVSRAAVMKFVPLTKTIPEIGRELQVASIMVGSVRFAGGRVRVSTQLVDAETQRNLWSETYEQPFGDVFRIEADIATNVATALQARLLPEDHARMAKVPTHSPEAHALYMQSRSAADTGETLVAASLVERAIAIDPKFAYAYAYASFLYAGRLINTARADAAPRENRAQFEALSQQYAKQALDLDPEVPWVGTALAVPAIARWRWNEAEKILARASHASSNDPDAPILHGFLLAWMGRQDEAVALIRDSRPPRPDDSYAVPYAAQLCYAGQHGAAIEVLENTIQAQPTNLVARDWMAMLELRRGNPVAAARQLEIAEQMAGDNLMFAFLPEWTYIYGRAGRQRDAERLFKRIDPAVKRGAQPGAGDWAMAHLGLGDHAQALRWLEEAASRAKAHEPEESNLILMNLKMNVTDDPLLKQPAFAEVLGRIKGD